MVRVARTARMLPAFDLVAAAETAGVQHPEMLQALRSCQPRGRCDHKAARVAVSHESFAAREAAISWRWCPPHATRRATEDRSKRVQAAARGTSAWPGRSVLRVGAARRVVAVGAQTDTSPHMMGRLRAYPAMIAGMLQHDDRQMRARLAYTPGSPPWVLAALPFDKEHPIEYDVARNENSPSVVLERLAWSDDHEIRCCVAENANCPPRVLEQLASDDHSFVRLAVSRVKFAAQFRTGQV